MVASDSFAEFLREQLAPLGRITMRRMFGKTGVFCDGFMLGMVRDNTLYLRVDEDSRVTFKEAESFPPLNYEKQGETIDLAFGAHQSACWTRPMSLSPGRERRWRQRGALRRRENGRRQGENQSRNREGGMAGDGVRRRLRRTMDEIGFGHAADDALVASKVR